MICGHQGFEVKKRQRLTLPGFTLVPSALVGLTALFGMGRGDPHRYSHLKLFTVILMMYVIALMQPINPPNHFTALSVIHHKKSYESHKSQSNIVDMR